MWQNFCGWLLKRAGWRIDGDLPNIPKFLLIGAPHTSNWDFVVCIIARFALGLEIKFLGKHQLFKPPFGWIFRALGGYPVVRHQRGNVVQDAVDLFDRHEKFVLGLAPEGTRKHVGHWRSGFYHIALGAKVPLVLLGLDFGNRRLCLSEPMYLTGDRSTDAAAIEAFFKPIQGKKHQPIPKGLGWDD
ncbi:MULTISPECIES: lysophospholipid acyltransferase family protein [Corallincola]|uniref:Acyltransferase n=2 Tax=Corallincola TaxID=1775176 RepID=A0ABY1WPX0_9GAMM|nr:MULTISPECIES: lysophospholipid acyltransferase family protein [Corallincola]TAA46771.1 acyltransferase [Corallincola spongiicola]TCI04416.1 acyltransferase [Corallincola luteus]